MLLTVIPTPTMGADIIAEGTWGTGFTWTLDGDGVLTISGTGELWYKFFGIPLVDLVERIVFGSGVTTIGKDAFSGCHSLTTVTIRALSDVHHICGSFPEGVTFIFLQRGDVNGEGTLDIIDMQMLFEHLSGAGSFAPTLAATVADVNADSETNILDYQALYRLIVNEDT